MSTANLYVAKAAEEAAKLIINVIVPESRKRKLLTGDVLPPSLISHYAARISEGTISRRVVVDILNFYIWMRFDAGREYDTATRL